MPVGSSIQAGQRITAAMLNGLSPQVAYKTSATTTSNTSSTGSNDPDLVLPMVAGAVYRVTYCYIVSTAVAGAGVITQMSLPTGSTQTWYGQHMGGSSFVTQTITSSSVTSTTVNANTNQTAWGDGMVITSSSAGNFQVIFYNTGTASAVTMQPGSFVQMLRVA